MFYLHQGPGSHWSNWELSNASSLYEPNSHWSNPKWAGSGSSCSPQITLKQHYRAMLPLLKLELSSHSYIITPIIPLWRWLCYNEEFTQEEKNATLQEELGFGQGFELFLIKFSFCFVGFSLNLEGWEWEIQQLQQWHFIPPWCLEPSDIFIIHLRSREGKGSLK